MGSISRVFNLYIYLPVSVHLQQFRKISVHTLQSIHKLDRCKGSQPEQPLFLQNLYQRYTNYLVNLGLPKTLGVANHFHNFSCSSSFTVRKILNGLFAWGGKDYPILLFYMRIFIIYEKIQIQFSGNSICFSELQAVDNSVTHSFQLTSHSLWHPVLNCTFDEFETRFYGSLRLLGHLVYFVLICADFEKKKKPHKSSS